MEHIKFKHHTVFIDVSKRNARSNKLISKYFIIISLFILITKCPQKGILFTEPEERYKIKNHQNGLWNNAIMLQTAFSTNLSSSYH